MPQNRHEQVIEIVGKAAGQGTYGFHLLGLLELFFQFILFFFLFMPFRNVPGNAPESGQRAGIIRISEPETSRCLLLPSLRMIS